MRDHDGVEGRQPLERDGRRDDPARSNRERTERDADPLEEGRVGEDGRARELHEHRRVADPADGEDVVAPPFRGEEVRWGRWLGAAAPG